MMLFEAVALTIFCSTAVLYLALKVTTPAETPADKFYRQIAEHCAANAAHFEAISYRYREPPAKPYRDGGIVHSHPRKVFGKRPSHATPDLVLGQSNYFVEPGSGEIIDRRDGSSIGITGTEGCSCLGAVGVSASAAQVSANAAILAAQ